MEPSTKTLYQIQVTYASIITPDDELIELEQPGLSGKIELASIRTGFLVDGTGREHWFESRTHRRNPLGLLEEKEV